MFLKASFVNKVAVFGRQLYKKKETPTQVFSLKFSKFLRTSFFVPPVAAFEHKAQEQFHFDLILLFLNSETKLPARYELFLWFLPSWEYVKKKYVYDRENYIY